MAFLTYVFVFAALFVKDSFQSEFIKCEEGPAPLSLRIDGCDKLPCELKRGTDLLAEWDFAVARDTETLRPNVDVWVFGKKVTYPYPEQNACKDLKNAECPLDEGEEVTYKLKMGILKIYPKIALTIQFDLVDEHNKSQACFKLEAKVV